MNDEYKKSVIIGVDFTNVSRDTLRSLGCVCELMLDTHIWINPGCPIHGDMLNIYSAASTAEFPPGNVRYGLKLPEAKR